MLPLATERVAENSRGFEVKLFVFLNGKPELVRTRKEDGLRVMTLAGARVCQLDNDNYHACDCFNPATVLLPECPHIAAFRGVGLIDG